MAAASVLQQSGGESTTRRSKQKKRRNEDPENMSKEKQREYLSDSYDSYDKYEGAWQKYLERTKQMPEQVKAALEAAEKVLEKDGAKQQENKMLNMPKASSSGRSKRNEKEKEDDLLR